MADTLQPPETAPADGPLILVVEDDAPLARLIEALLDSAGYRVISAGDGERALESVRSDHPALVLLDLTLPKLDGWEVLERLRAAGGCRPPVILFTGHHAALDRALEAGAAAAILKPFDVDDLLNTVERLLPEGAEPPRATGRS
ncbi:MAG TPA: response regulator [Vicinamibacteria bacterium]|nr:response regulator [Vicinamibacteria bacterium]